MAGGYNYAHFELDDEEMGLFDAFPTILPAGSKALSGTLVDAHSGEEVELASLWKRSHVLMEFGSFT